MIYYCNECETYFKEDDLIKDEYGEAVHYNCNENNYNELSETEIVDALNDKEIR